MIPSMMARKHNASIYQEVTVRLSKMLLLSLQEVKIQEIAQPIFGCIEHYPDSHLQDEGWDYDDTARYYSEIKIVAADGKSRTVFFETTSFWWEWVK